MKLHTQLHKENKDNNSIFLLLFSEMLLQSIFTLPIYSSLSY